jgi:hypothetical protein
MIKTAAVGDRASGDGQDGGADDHGEREADFHALRYRHDTVYGYDSVNGG